jgi:Cu-Zn family superoxide dismutase
MMAPQAPLPLEKPKAMLTRLSLLALTLTACATQSPVDEAYGPVVAVAVANVEARSGSRVNGTVTFTETERTASDGTAERRVHVQYDLHGLTPNEARGFHIHMVGNCSGADAMTAAGHFNPEGHNHGSMDGSQSHAGDLGNIKADANGNASGLIKDLRKITLRERVPNSVLWRSVIVHAQADDLVSQPTGNAGARVGCGVIVPD